jgi:uncharacterized Zn finger protein
MGKLPADTVTGIQGRCPSCGGKNLDYREVIHGDPCTYKQVDCLDCGQLFQESWIVQFDKDHPDAVTPPTKGE